MKMSKYKAVLFDFDGTLMDTTPIIVRSWNHTTRTLLGRELPMEELAQTFGEPILETCKKLFPDTDPHEAAEIYRLYQNSEKDLVIYMMDGMADLVRGLKARGILTGVVTSRYWTTSPKDIYEFPVYDDLDVFIGGEDSHAHKPDPEPVLMALERLGVKPSEAILIGDTAFDILCGHNAGVDVALVGWTLSVPEEQRVGAMKPEYVIDKAEDMYSVLEI
jgi:pyrophosphatase PpaX